MIDPTPVGPPEDRSPRLSDYEDAAYWVAARRAWDLIHPESFGPERVYKCSRCRDSGMRLVDPRGVGTYTPCRHDPDPWQDAPAYSGQLIQYADVLEPGSVLWLCERDAGDADSLAHEVARRWHAAGRQTSLLSLENAPKMETEGGWSHASPKSLPSSFLVIRGVHAGRTYHQCSCLASLLGSTRGRAVCIVGTDPEQLGERSRETVMAAVRARHGAVRGAVSQVRR